MNQPVSPTSIAPPAAAYSLGMVVPAGSEWLYTAGIVGTRPDGSDPEEIGEQADEAWRSIRAVLETAGFSITDIVAYTTYAVVGNDLQVVMAARDRNLAGHRAVSTLIPVAALARPAWKVEISIVAARQL
jgi:2-iminobutanoate/2-iminopropanoate deaminase